MNVVQLLAVVGVVVYVVGRQLIGEPIRAKRLLVLPAVLAAVGVLNLTQGTGPVRTPDVALIAAGLAVALVVGGWQGMRMRLEERDGSLWGQLPLRSLWLWVALYASRGLLVWAAAHAHAHVAGGLHAEPLVLGANRLGQGVVVALRANSRGIAFAPESERTRPWLASRLEASTLLPVAPSQPQRQLADRRSDRRDRRATRRGR